MQATAISLDTSAALEEEYRTALNTYLVEGDEDSLLAGYEIGRKALREGLGVIELTSIHTRAIAGLTRRRELKYFDDHMTFFVEAVSPFEVAHRAWRDGRAILRRLNQTLEGQAKRIAYVLHSEAGQLLACTHLSLAEAERGIPAEKAAHLGNVRKLLGEMEERLRDLSHELRPTVLDDFGLHAAIRLLATSISQRWDLDVALISPPLTGDRPASIESTIYRITQEALTNAAKHAGAKRVEVDLRQFPDRIVCSIRDDGIGFDGTAAFRRRRPGLGLTEIRERVAALGGVVRLGANGDSGTDLTFEIPLEVSRAADDCSCR